MPKRGGIELSTNFLVIIILSMLIFALGIVFIQKISSSSSAKVDQVDEQTRRELLRLLNEGEIVAIAPTTIHRQGVVLLMIANDGSVDSNKFGFKVFYDDCFNGPCGAPSPIDWISYPAKGHEDDPFEIKPHESKEFLIAVNPKGNPPSGTYVFDVDVRYDSPPHDGRIIHDELHPDVDDLYSRLKFYIKI